MKKEGSKEAIDCLPNWGPIFGNNYGDIRIDDKCNEEDSCWIGEPVYFQYDSHPEYKSSLYVNTDDPDNDNYFSVLDYEVYGIDYENRENINKLCKYPDIMMEYIETKDISEESLKQFADDIELLSDLDVFHCKDTSIRLKISHYYLKNPSEFLPNTQLVDKSYDVKLREWVGDYKLKLLYRSSEHGYTGKSFHEYCDNKKPTLIVIKSSGGWLFGGYTTKSWSGWSISNEMI